MIDVLFRYDPFDQFEMTKGRTRSLLAMDATRKDDEVLLYFDVPGVDLDDLDITIEKNSVTVEATRRWFDADVKTLSSERSQGTFKREIQLGDHFDTERIDATLDMGVLTLSVPVKEGTTPRSISVRTGERTDARQVAAKAS